MRNREKVLRHLRIQSGWVGGGGARRDPSYTSYGEVNNRPQDYVIEGYREHLAHMLALTRVVYFEVLLPRD